MKTPPLISVIITNYNYGDFVAQAIESVMNQTYKNVELIIINDGSTDDSDKVIKKYTKQNTEIIYVNQKNHGVVYSRNKGMEIASGQYLCCLDADDFFNPDYIQKQYDYITKYKADVVYPNWQLFGDLNYKTDFPEFNFVEYQKQHLHIKPESLIRSSSIKNKNGKLKYGYIPETKARANDWAYFISLAANGLKFKLAKNNYVNYQVKSGSMGNTFSRHEDVRIFYNYLTMFKKKYKQKIIDPVDLPIDIIKQQEEQIKQQEEQIARLDKIVQEKDLVIEDRNSAATKLENNILDIRKSWSYRIGVAIVKPVAIIKNNIFKRSH